MNGESIGAADIQRILSALPHRYPFLMVDRIIDIRGDQSAIGIKNVTANEPQFLGHFPGNPVFPGKCPRNCGSLAVTFLMPMADWSPRISMMRSTIRNG